jgi:ATP synthase protein I
MNRVHLRGISLAWAVCGIQALISAIFATAMWGAVGGAAAVAALFGGLIAIAPNVYMAFRVYARNAGTEPAQVAGRFYRAEFGRFALTALLFFFGVSLFAKQFLPLISAYLACLLAYWVVIAVARID